MVDRYQNFADLARHETEGEDYRIHVRGGATRLAIAAPHGGGIEQGTMEIADAIAGPEHHFYCFEGIKAKHNWRLHLTSDHFDEPVALAAVSHAERVVSIHGAAGWEEAVFIGGLDADLKEKLIHTLVRRGFLAAHDPSPTRQGRGMSNICNRGRSGRGVQLEITIALRRKMLAPSSIGGRSTRTEAFQRFVAAIRTVLGETP